MGIALLIAGLFFLSVSATLARPSAQEAATPTVSFMERLAKPTLPATPSQADLGAQAYWLYCLPCHGEKGQGLTEEFRQTYPPEEVYCWESGCHGKRPYEGGFTLPFEIKAVIGPGTLQKFPNAAVLKAFIAAAMPFWNPGSLKDEEYWQITSFLLRENGLWEADVPLGDSNAATVSVGPPAPQVTATPTLVAPSPGARLSVVGAAAALAVLVPAIYVAFRVARATASAKSRR